MELKKDFTASIIKTLLATLSIAYYCEIDRNVFFLIVIFILIYVFFKTNKYSKNIYTTILSTITNILLVLGKYLAFIESGVGYRTIAIRSILCLIGGFILFKELYNYIFALIDKKKINSKQSKIKPIYIFVISFIIILLAWVIVLIAEYPTPMMQDTLNQFMQIFGDAKYHNDHPFIHTMYIKALYDLASLFFKSQNNRLFFMASFQTILNASFYSFVSYYIYKKTNSILASFLTTLFYAFVSYNSVSNITISKDTSFTLASNLLLISTIFLVGKRNVKSIILFIFSSLLFCLVRKNGLYAYLFAFIVTALVFVITKRNKHLLLYVAISLLLAIFTKNTIIPNVISNMNKNNNHINEQSSFNEKNRQANYSIYIPAEIPMQQIANVVCHNRQLTEEEKKIIEFRCPIDVIKSEYDKYIIDPIAKAVREHTDYYSTEYSGTDYLKLWISLLFKYPQDFIESYVYLTRHYFYPNRIVNTNNYYVTNNDYGFNKAPLISNDFTNNVETNLDSQRNIPILNILYSPGTMMFIVFMLFLYYLYKKKYSLSIILSFFIGIWMTLMLVTPCSDSFRYIYPVVGAIPLIICLPLLKEEVE